MESEAALLAKSLTTTTTSTTATDTESQSEQQKPQVDQTIADNSTTQVAQLSAGETNKQNVKEFGATPTAKKILPQIQKIQYPKCLKGNFHEGELLNYVQINPANKDDILGCAVCQEESKARTWRPLKVVLHQALENTSKQANSDFNSDEIISYIDQQRSLTETALDSTLASFTEKLTFIKQTTLSFFDKMKDQVLSHTSATSTVTELLNSVYDFTQDIEVLKNSVHRLINFIPMNEGEEEQEGSLEKKAIRQVIESLYQDIQKTISTGNKEIEDVLERQKTSIQNQVLNAKLSKKKEANRHFSATLKHAQITLVTPLIAKSNGTTSSYRFAIIEPVLSQHEPSRFAFKIRNATSNWLALGLCHKNIVAQKNYGFQFSTIGHGAYMISTNSGSWSTTVPASNNTVKAFSFGKDDTIIVDYDPIGKTIKFKNEKSPLQSYKLDFTPVQNDPLYACVLFYFVNDEVEFVPKYVDSLGSDGSSSTSPPQQQ